MAMPLCHPGSLMTLDEWVALPEDNAYRYELQEGVLLVSPRAARRHRLAAQRLSQQLDGQLPVDWESVLDMEMVVRAEYPPIVRVPDMVVTRVGGPEDRLAASNPSGSSTAIGSGLTATSIVITYGTSGSSLHPQRACRRRCGRCQRSRPGAQRAERTQPERRRAAR
jgi:Putative restriction endonuclease